MIPNILNFCIGLSLACLSILDIHWIERQYVPLLPFAVVMLVLALWARQSDPAPWFSNVSIVVSILLGILALLPLPLYPSLTFWGGLWAGILIPCVSLWAALYRPESTQERERALRQAAE